MQIGGKLHKIASNKDDTLLDYWISIKKSYLRFLNNFIKKRWDDSI